MTLWVVSDWNLSSGHHDPTAELHRSPLQSNGLVVQFLPVFMLMLFDPWNPPKHCFRQRQPSLPPFLCAISAPRMHFCRHPSIWFLTGAFFEARWTPKALFSVYGWQRALSCCGTSVIIVFRRCVCVCVWVCSVCTAVLSARFVSASVHMNGRMQDLAMRWAPRRANGSLCQETVSVCNVASGCWTLCARQTSLNRVTSRLAPALSFSSECLFFILICTTYILMLQVLLPQK